MKLRAIDIGYTLGMLVTMIVIDAPWWVYCMALIFGMCQQYTGMQKYKIATHGLLESLFLNVKKLEATVNEITRRKP